MEKRKVTLMNILYKYRPVLNDKRSKGVQIYATTLRGNILNITAKKNSVINYSWQICQ